MHKNLLNNIYKSIFLALFLCIHHVLCMAGNDFAMPPTTKIIRLQSPGNVEMYATSPTMKILPDKAIATTLIDNSYGKIYLAGAPGESEQIQLVIKPIQNIQSLQLSFSHLIGNQIINSTSWSFAKVENVMVPDISTHYGIRAYEVGMVPDPVVSTPSVISLRASNYNTILLKLNIPRELQAGKYTGTVTVNMDGTETVIPVELTAWDFEFPTDKQIETYICGVDMGVNAKVLDLIKGTATQVKYGSNKMIRGFPNNELAIMTKYYTEDLKKLQETYGIKKVALPPNLLGQINTLSSQYLSRNVKVGSDEFYTLHERYLSLVRDSMRAVGLQNNIMYYPMDEFNPVLDQTFTAIARQSKEIYPEMEIMALSPYMNANVAQYSDIWCIPWHFFSTLESDPINWKQYKANNLDLWTYMNSLYTINADWNPKGMRFFPIVASRYDHSGALWWAINSYGGQDVWTTAGTAEGNKLYGAGYLVYPPRTNETEWHSSLRWESYVQGTEDYRLMELLKERWNYTASQLNVNNEEFSSYAAMQMFGSMLSSSFRVQTYFADPLYIDRFRQIIASEISTLAQPLYSLITVSPYDARNSHTVTIKGIVEVGSEVSVNGVQITNISSDGHFSVNTPLHNGINLIKIDVKKDDKSKTFYREVISNVASGVEPILGNNADLNITENNILLPYSESEIKYIRVYNVQGQLLQVKNNSNQLIKGEINYASNARNIYLIKVEFIDNRIPLSYKVIW